MRDFNDKSTEIRNLYCIFEQISIKQAVNIQVSHYCIFTTIEKVAMMYMK